MSTPIDSVSLVLFAYSLDLASGPMLKKKQLHTISVAMRVTLVGFLSFSKLLYAILLQGAQIVSLRKIHRSNSSSAESSSLFLSSRPAIFSFRPNEKVHPRIVHHFPGDELNEDEFFEDELFEPPVYKFGVRRLCSFTCAIVRNDKSTGIQHCI